MNPLVLDRLKTSQSNNLITLAYPTGRSCTEKILFQLFDIGNFFSQASSSTPQFYMRS
jgi:hypothetical protein